LLCCRTVAVFVTVTFGLLLLIYSPCYRPLGGNSGSVPNEGFRFFLAVGFLMLVAGCNSLPKQVYSVTVSPSSSSVTEMGQTFQFQATAVVGDRNGNAPQNVTTTAAWSSANPKIANIQSGGLAKSVGCGTTTITANYGGQIGQAQFTTCAPQVVLIVKKTGSTPATVVSSPAGIDCGLTCEALFDYGYSGVRLTATPSPASWTNCDQILPGNVCSLTVVPDPPSASCVSGNCRTVTANY
jgi:hypothetical protein